MAHETRNVKEVTAETRKGWAVYANSDLTEGKGREIVKFVCEIEATAIRLARAVSTQGSDGRIKAVDLLKIDGEWFGPVVFAVAIARDTSDQINLDRARSAEERARAAGLSDDDIDALRGGDESAS